MPVSKLNLQVVFLLLLSSCLLLFSCKEEGKSREYSIDHARIHMQHNNWDSAKIHAVNVLAYAKDEKEINLANFIISLANENLDTDKQFIQEKRIEIFKNLRLSFEPKEDITWVYDPLTTKYTNRNSFHIFMGTKNKKFWLNFRIQYRGYQALSMLGYTLNTDNNSYTFSPEAEIKSGKEGKVVWEWFDQEFTEREHRMIQDILSSDSARLILIGSQGNYERDITADEKTAMRNILEAFRLTPGFKGYYESAPETRYHTSK